MDKATREIRQTGIGGSDIGAIAGVNPYRTAHDVWLEKVGYIEQSDEPPSEAAYWGLTLEGILADEYARRENVGLRRPPIANGVIRSATDSWVIGSPDRFIDADPLVGVDLKLAGMRQSARWGEEGTDQVPDSYLLQVQWYTRLTNAVRWDLAVLLGQQFRIYRINPHKDLQQALHDIGARFWFDHVLKKVPPPVDHTEGARRMLDKIYPLQRDEIRPATDEEMALAVSYRQQQHAAQEAEIRLARLRNLLCDRIGLAEGVVGPDFKFTWKRSKDSQHTDWEEVARHMAQYNRAEFDATVKIHTAMRPGQRRFRSTFQEDADA